LEGIVKFLSSLLYYVEERGYPFAVAFKRAYRDNKPREVDSNFLYEYSRRFLLSYFSLPSVKKRSIRVKYWIEDNHDNITFPEWMEESLKNFVNLNLLKESLKSKVVWIRVNLLKTDIDKVIKALENYKIEFSLDKDLYYMIKIEKSKVRLSALDLVKEYKVIIQDKASSLVVEALKPEYKDKLIDLSSAPGVKASLYMMLTENKSEIFLTDIDFSRLLRELRLLKKSGVNMDKIHIIHQDSSRNSLTKGDKVLLDAPCSSSGMISNDPTILIKLNREKIIRFSNLQKKLINEAINIKAKELVYAVCSFFPEEGETIVDKYYDLLERPFDNYSSGYISFKSGILTNRTFPHIDSTEGFFISKLNLEKL
jgi:16S rRNA (cytosine967-C5)-methyltransferase